MNLSCFNGAALFRARRGCARSVDGRNSPRASTGPRSFERGERPREVEPHPENRLQRGRALSSAERILQREKNPKKGKLQRGRALSSAERRHRGQPGRTPSRLQRGRALSSAESAEVDGDELGVEALQRGRALSSAESIDSRTELHPVHIASTGPRSFERGEADRILARRRRRQCFNGAALFRARRALSPPGQGVGDLASTGPRSFERGERKRRPCSRSTSSKLQRGRALSSAESKRRPNGCLARWSASTGPRSFERGELHSISSRYFEVSLQRGRALSSAESASSRSMGKAR